MFVVIAIAAAYAAFVVWRVAMAKPVPIEEAGSCSPMTAQAPFAVELAFPGDGGSQPDRLSPD